LGAKTECEQNIEQEQVVLVAIAATPLTHEFLVERWQIKAGRPLSEDIEVLKRDSGSMLGDDRSQRCECRLARPRIPMLAQYSSMMAPGSGFIRSGFI
jgi:hypothetical protein